MPQLCVAAQNAGSVESSTTLAVAKSSVSARPKQEELEDRTPHAAFEGIIPGSRVRNSASQGRSRGRPGRFQIGDSQWREALQQL